MAQLRKAKKASNLPIESAGGTTKSNNNNNTDYTSEGDSSDEDIGILSKLLSPRKPADNQNYFNLIPDEICTTIFQYLDLESLCSGMN